MAEVEYTFPWERSAMEGREMPDGLSLPEQCAWQAVAHLYGRYRLKLITRETGHLEKGKIKHALYQRLSKDKDDSSLAKWHADLRKEIEGAQIRYRKERTLEAADALSAALDGRLS